ncbi:MAG: lysophospholipid acyltransferase family protein [Candidatus Riflebacteria bacterium]|nr:lysophospholipid acyltransferase family protein [Candidatus Riflebacteria bacterium]
MRDTLKRYKRMARAYLIKGLVSLMTRLEAPAVPKLKRLLLKAFPIIFAKEIQRARELLPVEFAERSDSIIAGMAENQIMTLLEVFFYEKLLAADPDFVQIEGREYIDNAVAQNKGLIILSSHFGNWEVAGYTLAKMGLPLHVIAREQAVDQMTRLMNSFRENRGITLIMHNTIPAALKLLANKKTVGLLSDLNARERGYQVRFFGRTASFYNAPVLMALRSRAPLVPVFAERQKNGRLLVRFEKPVEFKRGDSMLNNIQRYVDRYESAYRRRPDHWCWFHERYEFASLGRIS